MTTIPETTVLRWLCVPPATFKRLGLVAVPTRSNETRYSLADFAIIMWAPTVVAARARRKSRAVLLAWLAELDDARTHLIPETKHGAIGLLVSTAHDAMPLDQLRAVISNIAAVVASS